MIEAAVEEGEDTTISSEEEETATNDEPLKGSEGGKAKPVAYVDGSDTKYKSKSHKTSPPSSSPPAAVQTQSAPAVEEKEAETALDLAYIENTVTAADPTASPTVSSAPSTSSSPTLPKYTFHIHHAAPEQIQTNYLVNSEGGGGDSNKYAAFVVVLAGLVVASVFYRRKRRREVAKREVSFILHCMRHTAGGSA